MSDKDQLYTTKEACAYLRVSRETLRLLNPKREYVGARPRYRRADLDNLAWCSLWLNAARQATRPGAVLCSFIDWRQLPTLTDAVQAGGWTWRNLATWWKPGIRMQRGAFSSSAEYIVYATNGPSSTDFDGAVQNVFRCAPVDEKRHIAEKPLDVLKWITCVVPPRSRVLDPFMGSGVTLEAAKAAGHVATGIDSDERYCEIAAERCRQEVLELGA